MGISVCGASLIRIGIASVSLAIFACGTAAAGTIMPCDGQCTWSIQSDGSQVASGQFTVDPGSGDIDLQPLTVRLGGGNWVGINDLSGNTDPVLDFGVSAGAGPSGKTFTVTFSLPIQLTGVLDVSSSVGYSLTSLSGAGAQVTPLNSHLAVASEVDSSVNGLGRLNNGVDVGDIFFTAGGPHTVNSPTYTATNDITANLAYDLMTVTLGFALSPRSSVNISGFVEQLPIDQIPTPLPPSAWLLASALLGLLLWQRGWADRLAWCR